MSQLKCAVLNCPVSRWIFLVKEEAGVPMLEVTRQNIAGGDEDFKLIPLSVFGPYDFRFRVGELECTLDLSMDDWSDAGCRTEYERHESSYKETWEGIVHFAIQCHLLGTGVTSPVKIWSTAADTLASTAVDLEAMLENLMNGPDFPF